MDFIAAVSEAASIPEFVAQYDRLYSANLGRVISATGINRMIDSNTGYAASEWAKFMTFFYEFVWSRLPDEAFEEA